MSGPRFAHLTGRPMWEHCDHVGTRIEGTPAAVVLATAATTTDSSAPAVPVTPADYAAWQARLGSAVVLPCAPDQCTAAQAILAAPGKPLNLLTPAGWLPLPTPATDTPAPTPGLAFAPVAPAPAPSTPDAIALDPAGRCWLLDRAGRRLILLAPDLRVLSVVTLPPDIDPGGFACSAFGLVVADRTLPRLVVQPWGGTWHGYVPPLTTGRRIVAVTANPAWPEAIALVEGGPDKWQLFRVGPGGAALHTLPMAAAPLPLILTAADRLLVGEVSHRPGEPLPCLFREYILHADSVEAERGFAVRSFDGRALWLEKDVQQGCDSVRVMASTAAGARPLYPREADLAGSGVVETWALDSGIFGCQWHRLFMDLCLPADCAVHIEARTADDLPPFEIRRRARLPADRVGDSRPAPIDDSWPPLGSVVDDEAEGWVPLGVADRRPARADVAFAGSLGERPSEDPLAGARQPAATLPAGMLTLEYLLTPPPGRYLWLRVRLAGTRRQGPSLFALRATFPRPSLLDYLPAYWRSDPAGADATERALALFEGWMTETDQRIDVLPQLIDPRLVPAEALPWLGSFLALSFDARVREGVRRELLLHMAELYRARGTQPGLTRLLSILAEAPVQIIEGFRLRRPTAAFLGNALIGPALELGGSESTLDAAGLEDWEQELAGAHAALMLRRAAQDTPCPARDPDDPQPDDALLAFYRRHAHRFTVIVPRARCSTLAAVLELAIETAKPAHTLHRLCWLDAGFRVGSASLVGISHLGPVDRAEPAVLGSAVLSTFTTLHRGRREDSYPYFKPMNPWEASP
jgi:phage tail-like protein